MFSFLTRNKKRTAQLSHRVSDSKRRWQRRILGLEGLEDRRVLASIVWVNEGQDHFDEVFGAQANVARNVVHSVVDAWENVIDDFHNNNGNTYNLYLRMATQADVDQYGFGGGVDPNRIAGQAPPSAITVANGIPHQGLVLLGRGFDGHGDGYFIDPTPYEHSEFQGEIINAFAGRASDPAAMSEVDFYSLVQAEVSHALGITSATNSRYRELIDAGAAGVNGVSLTNTTVLDANYLAAGAELWEFNGPSINYLMTDIDGDSKRYPVHSALPNNLNVVVGQDNDVLRGNINLSNSALGNGTRLLISNAIALMLQDTYGYTLNEGGPERQATFYALQDSQGDVHGRGTPQADSVIVNHGVATIQYSINPGVDVTGTDSFSPGGFFMTRFSTASVEDTVIDLDAGNDSLLANGTFGGVGSIRINGQAGDDNLNWSLVTGHSVVMFGGDGNDTLRGGAIADTIVGDAGNDTIYGNNGNDNLLGEAGNDRIYGGNGHDVLRGRDGNDRLYGENDDDQVLGGAGDDQGYGGNGNDFMLGDLGNDTLEGNAGNDTIQGNRGNDTIIGGTTLVVFNIVVSDGADVLDGNEDDDTILGDNSVQLVPNTLGGAADTIRGGAGHDRIFGGVGDDQIWGDAGLDIIQGNLGADTISGGADNDQITGNEGDDLLQGDEGDDFMLGSDGDDTLHGGVGNDRLNGQVGSDSLYGGTGDDIIRGEDGNDSLRGEDGNDILLGGTGRDELLGGLGRDLLIGGRDADRITGDELDDILIAGTTVHDNNDRALINILSEWRSLHAYTDRVMNLRNVAHPLLAQRLNGNYFLRSNIEVFSDNGGNVLSGLSGNDLFYFGLGDVEDSALNEAKN